MATKKFEIEGKTNNGKRGTTDNQKRLDALRGNKAAADWGSVDGQWFSAVVVAATRIGGAVRFGLSRDSGAYAVGVYVEGASQTLYCNGGDDPTRLLQQVLDFFDQLWEAERGDRTP